MINDIAKTKNDLNPIPTMTLNGRFTVPKVAVDGSMSQLESFIKTKKREKSAGHTIPPDTLSHNIIIMNNIRDI